MTNGWFAASSRAAAHRRCLLIGFRRWRITGQRRRMSPSGAAPRCHSSSSLHHQGGAEVRRRPLGESARVGIAVPGRTPPTRVRSALRELLRAPLRCYAEVPPPGKERDLDAGRRRGCPSRRCGHEHLAIPHRRARIDAPSASPKSGMGKVASGQIRRATARRASVGFGGAVGGRGHRGAVGETTGDQPDASSSSSVRGQLGEPVAVRRETPISSRGVTS